MLVLSPPSTTRHPCSGIHHHLETPLYRPHNPLEDGTDRHEGIHDENESPQPGRCGDYTDGVGGSRGGDGLEHVTREDHQGDGQQVVDEAIRTLPTVVVSQR